VNTARAAALAIALWITPPPKGVGRPPKVFTDWRVRPAGGLAVDKAGHHYAVVGLAVRF
jgi:hypothetical protein